MIEGYIRKLEDCQSALNGVAFVLHQAALGLVPHYKNNLITTSEVNVSGFLNVLLVSRDAQVKKFVYAACSSACGDLEGLPKIKKVIGKPLSPYAISK